MGFGSKLPKQRRATLGYAATLCILLALSGAPGVRWTAFGDGLGAPPGTPRGVQPSPVANGDTIVLLSQEVLRGPGVRDKLQAVLIREDGGTVVKSEVLLPPDWWYEGPVAISDDTCGVIAYRPDPMDNEVVAYEWRLGDPRVSELAAPTMAFPNRAGWGLGLLSYSRVSGEALVAPAAPERLADPPLLWKPGDEHSKSIAEAYPAFRSIGKRWVTSACFSPDGSLLAAAVLPAGPSTPVEILVYDLRAKELKTFTGPSHYQYPWTLAVSPDNKELLWVDTGYAHGLLPFEKEGREVPIDKYEDAGYGIIALDTGKWRYTRLLESKSFAANVKGSLLTFQHRDTCAFSHDGRRIYLPSLVRLERQSDQWRIVLKENVIGFAVMPSAATGQERTQPL